METIIVIKKIIVTGLIFSMVSNAFAMRQTPYQYRHIMAPQPTRKIFVMGMILANLPSVYAEADENGPLGITLVCVAAIAIGAAIGFKLYSLCQRTPQIVPAMDIEPSSTSQSSNSTIVNLHSDAGSRPNTPVSGFSDEAEKDFTRVSKCSADSMSENFMMIKYFDEDH